MAQSRKFDLEKKFNEENNLICPISAEYVDTITPCGHLFQKEAITQWILSGEIAVEKEDCFNECPVCREKIYLTKLIPMYGLTSLVLQLKNKDLELEKIRNELVNIQKIKINTEEVSMQSNSQSGSQSSQSSGKLEELSIFAESRKRKLDELKSDSKKEDSEQNQAKKQKTGANYDAKMTDMLNTCVGNADLFHAADALAKNANANYCDNGIPLIIKALNNYNNVDFVRLLAKHNANVNAKDPNGLTVLHHAVRNGNTNLILTLLELGSDPRIENDNNETALQYMKNINKGDNLIAEILRNREYELNQLEKQFVLK